MTVIISMNDLFITNFTGNSMRAKIAFQLNNMTKIILTYAYCHQGNVGLIPNIVLLL